MLLMLLNAAVAGDLDAIQVVAADHQALLDDAGRPRIAVASSRVIGGGDEKVAINTKGGGLLVVREIGMEFIPDHDDVIVSPTEALTRKRDLLLESQRQFVTWLSREAEEDRLGSVGIPEGFMALLGPACPARLCESERAEFGVLDGFPTVEDREPRHYGDVGVSNHGNHVIFTLDENHFLVLGGGTAPRVVLRPSIEDTFAELPWFRLTTAATELGADLSSEQVEGLVARLSLGLPDTIEIEPPPARYPSPRLAPVSLALDTRSMADGEGLAPGVGIGLDVGVPLRPLPNTVPVLMVTPFVGVGATRRVFPQASDGRYEGLQIQPLSAAGGIGVGVAVPSRENWWVLQVAPAVRADGFDPLSGTTQTWSVETPIGAEYRWPRVALRAMVGPEFGRRTAGINALDGPAWDPFFGTSVHLSTVVYFLRENR